MFNRLAVEDFEVLREPLKSGRQSPNSIAFALILSAFLQAIFYYLIYYIAGIDSMYPNVEKIQSVHFWITALLIVASLLYSMPFVFHRGQKIQYLLSILSIQNIGLVCCYLGGVFLIGEWQSLTTESLVTFTTVTLLLALALFVSIFIRLVILLQKGLYREGSANAERREKFEKKSYIIPAIIGSTGLVFAIQFLVRKTESFDLNDTFLIGLCFVIFYVMVFILPEQLVILYCKFRFKSFNFDKKGFLERD